MSFLAPGSMLAPTFPPIWAVVVLGFAPRSQWRYRAGLAPASSSVIALPAQYDTEARATLGVWR